MNNKYNNKNKKTVKVKLTAKELDIVVSRNLRTYRIKFNVTQGQIATILGISPQQVQKYERGINRISAGRLYIISHFLDVPIQNFLTDNADIIEI